MSSFVSSRLSLLTLALVLTAACGGDTKQPAAADAKNPDKGATPTAAPVAAKTDPGKPAEGPVKKVDGADPTDDRYSLRIDANDGVVGSEGSFKVTVVPKAPWHMNLDFPTSLAMGAPDGVKLAKADLKKADAAKLDENSAEFAVKFTPEAAGDKTFTGTFKFAVCQDEACSPVTEEVAVKIAVK
jgi:hypothetical protein